MAGLVEEWGAWQAGSVALLVSEPATNPLLRGYVLGRLFQSGTDLSRRRVEDVGVPPRGEPRPASENEQFGPGLLITQELASDRGVEGAERR